jgi:hypothetical protein
VSAKSTFDLNSKPFKAARLACLAAILGAQAVSASTASAAIPYALRSSVMLSYVFTLSKDFRKGLNASAIQPVESSRLTKSEDVSRIIPASMAPTDNSGLVAGQILDHSFSNWFNSEEVKRSSFGRTAHKVEKSLTGEITIGGTKPQSIRHNLRFQMKAAQTQAQVEYTGLTTAQFTYYMMQDKSDIEVREPMKVLNTQLVYNHTISRDDRRDIVSLRWAW